MQETKALYQKIRAGLTYPERARIHTVLKEDGETFVICIGMRLCPNGLEWTRDFSAAEFDALDADAYIAELVGAVNDYMAANPPKARRFG